MKKRLIAGVLTFIAVLAVLIGGFSLINSSSTNPDRMLIVSNRSQAQLITKPSHPNNDVAIGERQNDYNYHDLGVYRIEKSLSGDFVAKNKDRSIPLYDVASNDGKMRTDRNLEDVQGGHYLNLNHSVYKNVKNGMVMVIEP